MKAKGSHHDEEKEVPTTMKARVLPETRKALVLGDKGWWEKPRTFRAPHLIIEEVREAKGAP